MPITPLQCPMCGAINPPRTRICLGCGLDLATWEDKQAALRAQESRFLAAHAEGVQADAQARAQSAIQASQLQSARLIRWTLATLVAAAMVVALVTAVFAWRYQVRQAHLADLYEAALVCVNTGDYACAIAGIDELLAQDPDFRDARAQRDNAEELARLKQLAEAFIAADQCLARGAYECAINGFEAILAEEPAFPGVTEKLTEAKRLASAARLAEAYALAESCRASADLLCTIENLTIVLAEDANYPDAATLLDQARYDLATQYLAAERFRLALDQLDALLARNPGHSEAAALVGVVYDRWIAYARASNDWWTVVQLSIERRNRAGSEAP